MNDRQKRFIDLLENIFELDKSDLDFGIYRIMNIRRAEIEKFFKEGLPKKISETLAPFAGADSATIRKRMAEIEAALGGIETLAHLPVSVPMVAEYNDLKKKLAEGVDISALESDVYSALYSFFSRYYDDGDFISKRRYKEGVYAIPYEGEEVKLYWANQDQYYIKTSENFKDYTFKTNEADGITVHFRLVDATTEQNNNKESDDKKRTFMLYTETAENPDLHTFEYDAEKRELIIRFIYDIPANTKTKWHEVNMKAIRAWVTEEHPELINELLRNVSTKSGEFLPITEKHLKGYVAKNTFDYFIHKDLGGFLRRELDFFIKNEVMHIDDIDTDNETRVESYLGKVRAIKRVGAVIIDFLAQVEEFQKRLWLKKKFVVETNYCITLDKIDERFYAEIAANEAQVKEWIEMYAINEIKADTVTIGFSLPLSIDFLKQNKNLIVDTRHFDTIFRDRLIASIDNLDMQTNGVMINADNFHALQFLQEKYKGAIKCTYIDPPYNTDASEIMYKNNYKHSSFLSLMSNRLELAHNLFKNDGMLAVAIDDAEYANLAILLDKVFEKNAGVAVVRSNPQSRKTKGKFSPQHEYSLFYAINEETAPCSIGYSESKLNRYPLIDDIGHFSWMNFIRAGNNDLRTDRPKLYYPIAVDESNNLRILNMVWNDARQAYDLCEEVKENEVLVYPNKLQNGVIIEKNWQRGHERVSREIQSGEYRVRRTADGISIDFKTRMDENAMPTTWWDKNEYASANYAPSELKSLFGEKPFDFAKAVTLVMDTLNACGAYSDAVILDFFAGSGTTGHAVLALNRNDNSNRKYILVEMGEYFSKVTQPRIKKVVYSAEWKDGKPKNRTSGVSHIMKYMRLESYEDALSNIELKKTNGISLFGEDYLINYMLEMESRDSLLSIDKFRSPFKYKMRITEKNECRERQVDVCETFNYLIGLSVYSQSKISYFSAEKSSMPAYESAVELKNDDGGVYGFRQIEGTLPDGRRALVIWRTITGDTLASNAALDAYFSKYRINPADREYDIIYVNGDNNLENLHTDEDKWKVEMIEKVFNEKMWEA